jgi:hypothetical protein
MNDDWRLTEVQVSTAREMHAELKNWRFADRAFEFLKERQFESEEVCLLIVVALDALYSTNLRFSPGRREEIARHIFRVRERLLEPAEVTPVLVLDIAQGTTAASISFASKFCHFFVSADYPIYDSFVRAALEEIIGPKQLRRMGLKVQDYAHFSSICHWMTTLKGSAGVISMRELDQCLWLQGQYLVFDETKESRNEVQVLFRADRECARMLLPEHSRRHAANRGAG